MLLILLLPLSSRAQDVISTIVGGGTALGTGTALTASLGTPTAVVTDATGNLYVSSLNGEYVFKIDTLNSITVLAGTGFAGFSGVGGLATSATLTAPAGIALDSNGNLLVADVLNQHVYEVDLTTGILSNIAGSASATNPLGGFGGDGGSATQALLNAPQSVAVFGSTIYIADSLNNRIRSVVNGTINTIAGNGTACSPPTGTCGDGGPATLASLNTPSGVAVDALGNIFIADTLDNRIREISATTGTITTVAGTGTP